jgi:hypothetical protein
MTLHKQGHPTLRVPQHLTMRKSTGARLLLVDCQASLAGWRGTPKCCRGCALCLPVPLVGVRPPLLKSSLTVYKLGSRRVSDPEPGA